MEENPLAMIRSENELELRLLPPRPWWCCGLSRAFPSASVLSPLIFLSRLSAVFIALEEGVKGELGCSMSDTFAADSFLSASTFLDCLLAFEYKMTPPTVIEYPR